MEDGCFIQITNTKRISNTVITRYKIGIVTKQNQEKEIPWIWQHGWRVPQIENR